VVRVKYIDQIRRSRERIIFENRGKVELLVIEFGCVEIVNTN
jgi:hypothetical protein